MSGRAKPLRLSVWMALFLACSHCIAAKTSDLGNAEEPTSLEIEIGHSGDPLPGSEILLVGPEARRQLVVTAGFSQGQVQDYTHRVRLPGRPSRHRQGR